MTDLGRAVYLIGYAQVRLFFVYFIAYLMNFSYIYIIIK